MLEPANLMGTWETISLALKFGVTFDWGTREKTHRKAKAGAPEIMAGSRDPEVGQRRWQNLRPKAPLPDLE